MSRSISIIVVSTSLGASGAMAQTADPIELDPISVEAAEALEAETEGANTISIDSEQLAQQNPSDLQDLFKGEPGVSVGSSIPASQKLYVNGVEETNLSVTIDGNRQNNKIFHHNATTLIDPSLLKAVRIEPGVASADAGPGALAGSIAYETKDVDDLLDPGLGFGGFLRQEYDTNGDTFTTSTSLYGRSGGFEYLGFFKFADGNTLEDGSNTEIIGSGSGMFSGLAKIAYEAETGDRFEFSYERVNDDELRPYRANIGSIIGPTNPLTRNYDLDRQNVTFTYTDETPTGWWDPKISLGYSTTDLGVTEDEQLIFGQTDSINGVFQNRFPIGIGSITAGIDFYSDTAELDFQSLENPAINERGEEKARNIGAFVQARLEPMDRMRLSFGARADFQEFTGVDGVETDDSGLSGNISAEYDITDQVTISGGASHVWGGVALAENFIINPGWTYPAGGITPVTSDNIFLGVDAAFGRWNLDGRVFRTDISDARVPRYPLTDSGLTADLQSEGFELGVGYRWQNGFVRVGYANIDTTVNGTTSDSDTGRYLTTPIGEVVTIAVVQTFPQHDLSIGMDAEIVLKETNTFNPDTGAAGPTLPSYEVFNAFVEYTPRSRQNLTLRAEINNIFDSTYANRATYGQEFGSVNPLNEPGRSISLSAQITF